jgi:hypothetical protein
MLVLGEFVHFDQTLAFFPRHKQILFAHLGQLTNPFEFYTLDSREYSS